MAVVSGIGVGAVELPPVSGFVAVVGSRSAPASAAPWVADVVSAAAAAGVPVATGGAVGADLLALSALVAGGPAACRLGAVWSAWGPLPAALPRFPAAVRPLLSRFVELGGRVEVGPWVGLPPAAALARRAVALCSAAGLVVCLLVSAVPPAGAVGGSWGSVLAAVRAGVPVVALPCGFPPAALPSVVAGVAGAWRPVAGESYAVVFPGTGKVQAIVCECGDAVWRNVVWCKHALACFITAHAVQHQPASDAATVA